MKAFINLFLTIVIPVSVLFIAIGIIYFLMNFEINKAIRLGTIGGFLGGIVFSIILTIFLSITRAISRSTQKIGSKNNKIQRTIIPSSGPVDEKLMLLMDMQLAFEVSLYAISDQEIGNIVSGDRQKGSIVMRSSEESISISISPLTKHTSEVEIKANSHSNGVYQIINYLKNKEHSFINY